MAYAAVISLKRNLVRLTNHTIFNPKTTKPAYDKLKYLQEILQELDARKEKQSFDTDAINAVEADIRDAVWKAEDVIESYAFYHSLPPSESDNGCTQLIDIRGVDQELDSFIRTAETLGSIFNTHLDNPLVVEEDDEATATSQVPDFISGNKSATTTTIGISDEHETIRNQLLVCESKVVSLVGMAGIGKTHLAAAIYQDPLVVESFHFRTWVRVSQKKPPPTRNILAEIHAQVERKPRNFYLDTHIYTLSQRLRKRWRVDSRYLIVLDGVWSADTCYDLMLWLPVDRDYTILQTTRLEELEIHDNKIHRMRFLDNQESWDLFWQNTFTGKTSFPPPQLEKVGRKIAEKCEGLPLLILAVANILGQREQTEEYWNKVVNNKTSTFENAYEEIFEVLLSSYEFLPGKLKTCFLYMGVFPQTCKIRVSKLVNLWSADEIIEPTSSSDSLEDFFVECVKKLVSNSLVIVCKRNYKDGIKLFKLHSVYWYLGVKIARKNKFFHVLKRLSDGSKDHIENQRRLSVQNSILFGIKQAHDSVAKNAFRARSLLFTGEDHEYPVPICLDLKLLRVVDALPIRLYEFPEEVVKLLLLRYLALTHNGKLSSSISKLQALQFLIVHQHHNIKFLRDYSSTSQDDSTYLPMEIWSLQKIKHLSIVGRNLPDPAGLQLPNLVTLYVNARSCTEAVFRSIPSLKKLGIQIELLPDGGESESLSCFEHIMLLDQLESLKCVVVNPWLLRSRVVASIHHLSSLPKFLKKLSLSGLGYPWEHMSVIGSLPKLELLKLQCFAFQGPTWRTKAGEFPSLKFLLLEDINLVEWIVSDTDVDSGDDTDTASIDIADVTTAAAVDTADDTADDTDTSVFYGLPHLLERICNCFLRREGEGSTHNATVSQQHEGEGSTNDDNCFLSLEHLVIRHCFKLKEIPLEIGKIPTLMKMEVEDCSPTAVASAQQILNNRSSLLVVIDSSWNR